MPLNPLDSMLVGQPLQLLHSEVTATGFCKCNPDPLGRTLLILHQGVLVLCTQCGRTYLLHGVNPNGTLNIEYRKKPDLTPNGN